MTRHSEHDAHTQIAETPEVRRRKAAREVRLPPGVKLLHIAVGKINGDDVLLAFTDDGLYSIRDGVAHKCPEIPARPFRRSDDIDRRWVGYALVIVGVIAALWWTL